VAIKNLAKKPAENLAKNPAKSLAKTLAKTLAMYWQARRIRARIKHHV
jgi:hypothetical protein